jgi:hypothetical protein
VSKHMPFKAARTAAPQNPVHRPRQVGKSFVVPWRMGRRWPRRGSAGTPATRPCFRFPACISESESPALVCADTAPQRPRLVRRRGALPAHPVSRKAGRRQPPIGPVARPAPPALHVSCPPATPDLHRARVAGQAQIGSFPFDRGYERSRMSRRACAPEPRGGTGRCGPAILPIP